MQDNIYTVTSKNYLFVSAFEHNGEGTMTNQVFPVELKLANRLHGRCANVIALKQNQEKDCPTEADTLRPPCRR